MPTTKLVIASTLFLLIIGIFVLYLSGVTAEEFWDTDGNERSPTKLDKFRRWPRTAATIAVLLAVVFTWVTFWK